MARSWTIAESYVPRFMKKIENGLPIYNTGEKVGLKIIHTAPLEWRWRIIGVHHLTGPENGKKHHLYCDLFDEYGDLIEGVVEGFRYAPAEEHPYELPSEKPWPEPAINLPLYENMTVNIKVKWPGPLPSDEVTNIHTRHGNIGGAGNEEGHHSFYVAFQKTPPQTLEQAIKLVASERITVFPSKQIELDGWVQTNHPEMGEQLTHGYIAMHGTTKYLAQNYENGIAYVKVGNWTNRGVILDA